LEEKGIIECLKPEQKVGKIYALTKKGIKVSKEYWKMLYKVFEDYINHAEAKSDGDIGVLERKHIEINKDSIKYIGKEANNLEFSMVRGAFSEDSNEYVNEQKKLREIIENLTLEKALEIGISRRAFFYLKTNVGNNIPITLKKKTLEKLFHFM